MVSLQKKKARNTESTHKKVGYHFQESSDSYVVFNYLICVFSCLVCYEMQMFVT